MSYQRENILPSRYHEPPSFHYGTTTFQPPHHPTYHEESYRENPWNGGTASSRGYLANYYKDFVGNVSQTSYHRSHHPYHPQPPTLSSSSNRTMPDLYPIEAFPPAPLQFAAPHPFIFHPHYQNTQPAHVAPTLRHILTHYQPPSHYNRDDEAGSNDNGIVNLSKSPVSRKRHVKTSVKSSSDAEGSGQSDTVEKRVDSPKSTIPLTPRKSRIAWKKRYYDAIAAQIPPPESTSSSLSSDGMGSEEPEPNQITSPKELDLSLKKKVPKRKRDRNHHPEVGNEKKSEIPVPNKKVQLLSKVHETKDWIKKGVVVKSIQHDRPMGTIMGVNKDKSVCTLQFFRGWRAEIHTKFIAPVLSGEND